MFAEILKYFGLFVLGYFGLIVFGLDNSITAQWILIFVVAFHKQLIGKVYEIIRSPNDNNT